MPSSCWRTTYTGYALLNLFLFLQFAIPQDACVQQAITKVVVYEQSIYINTNVLHNSTFAINPDFTFTVNDAPTSLDLTTTYLSTAKSIISATGPSTPDRNLALSGSPFVLVIYDPSIHNGRRRKRQSGGSYLGTNGQLTTQCSNANAYNLVNGQLFVTNSGVTQQFSTNANVPYQAFLPSSSVGTITTTFSLTAGSALLWTNTAFYAGNTQFCVMPSGVINAVFAYGAEPSGCVFISLTISDCRSGISL